MRLSPRCYAITGLGYIPPWSANAGFVCGDRRTLVVDTGPTAQAAATIVGYAEAAAPDNAIVAVNTELHLDHIAGNSLLRELRMDVYGHVSIARTQADLADDIAEYRKSVIDPERCDEAALPFLGTRIANPNRQIEHDLTLHLQGVTAELLLVPGHTTANLAVWVPQDRVLYAGDTVVSDYRPGLPAEGGSSVRLWLESLDRLESLDAEILVPGHGRILRGQEIQQEIDRVRRCVRVALTSA